MQALALACAVSAGILAADFRVISAVYEGDGKAPLSTNLTLFHAGVVYDVVETAPREATVFDPHRGRLVLLDLDGQRKSEISTRELTAFSAEVRQRSRDSRDPLLRFVAEPAFEVAEVVEPARIEFRSSAMDYSVVAIDCHAEAASEYREFADWYAQLNTLTRPRALPGFARMEVNRQLAERSQVPTEVRLTLHGSGLARDTRLRSVHEFQWKLLAEDRRLIDTIGRQLAEFEAASLEDYQHGQVARRVAAKR